MIKYKEVEFSTIYSQEVIKTKLDRIVRDESLFGKNNEKKEFSGYVNNYGFVIHNKKSPYMYSTINYWKILIKGTMTNDNNLTNVKIRIRILHGEILYMYAIFLILLCATTTDGFNKIILIIFSIIFILITLLTISKIKNMDNEIRYYEKLIVKTIVE